MTMIEATNGCGDRTSRQGQILARKPIAALVSIMSARSGSACVDISITGTGAPVAFLKRLSKI